MTELIRLRELPGIAEIEAMMEIRSNFDDRNIGKTMDAIDAVSISLFSMVDFHTEFDLLEFDEPMTEREWERNFANVLKPFEQTRPFWEAIGWDISDGKGAELTCAHFFGRQIIVVAAGDSLIEQSQFTPDGSGQLAEAFEGLDLDEEALAQRLEQSVQAWYSTRR